jgi:hypothetical protein
MGPTQLARIRTPTVATTDVPADRHDLRYGRNHLTTARSRPQIDAGMAGVPDCRQNWSLSSIGLLNASGVSGPVLTHTDNGKVPRRRTVTVLLLASERGDFHV